MKPHEIEALSFEIIEKEAKDHSFSHSFSNDQWQIVRRMIHTSADFEYLNSTRIHPEAIDSGIRAIQAGKTVITDTNMALSGVRKASLESFDSKALCLMGEPGIDLVAKKNGITRAKAAVDAAVPMIQDGIYVVGNAPTALLRLIELIRARKVFPALVIGFPVGFVNAAESKAELLKINIPYITNVGRKGGSNIAASVMNALIIMAENGNRAN